MMCWYNLSIDIYEKIVVKFVTELFMTIPCCQLIVGCVLIAS